jgi:Glycine rich protein
MRVLRRLRWGLAASAVAAAVVLPVATTALGTIATFKSTGKAQRYVVPAGVQLVAVRVQGASGGGWGGGPGAYTTTIGQSGAAFQGLLPVKPGQALYVDVGANGTANGGAGFGGGGKAGSPDPEGAESGSGGGATDIRSGSSPASRIIVAGGAGGNGGSAVTAGAGLQCSLTQGGSADNEQPLPAGNPSLGPIPIKTSAGYVIPGFAGADDHTVMTRQGFTDAGPGTTSAGRGGSGSSCAGGGAYANDTFSGSIAGSPGAGSGGGGGGNAATLQPQPCGTPGKCNDAGPGGGGGGGYFGGGGGPTGFDTCSPGSCGVTGSLGGGAGSSFVSKSLLYPGPTIVGNLGSGVPYAQIAPVLSISSPANGAVYHAGQVVDASWSCAQAAGWGFGVQNCMATVPSGGKIATTPGKHTFTVKGIAQNASEPVSVTVTYTVR